MVFDPTIHRRRSIRLRGYDYAQAGAYFLTICAQDRLSLFGEINEGVVELNAFGDHVLEAWLALPGRFPLVELDAAVVMPNHFHGILLITAPEPGKEENQEPLGSMVAWFKYRSTKAINQERRTPGQRVWQRNYYEHVIRDDHSLDRLRRYVEWNPQRWAEDQLHPDNPSRW